MTSGRLRLEDRQLHDRLDVVGVELAAQRGPSRKTSVNSTVTCPGRLLMFLDASEALAHRAGATSVTASPLDGASSRTFVDR
jgi:hypothetical protein